MATSPIDPTQSYQEGSFERARELADAVRRAAPKPGSGNSKGPPGSADEARNTRALAEYDKTWNGYYDPPANTYTVGVGPKNSQGYYTHQRPEDIVLPYDALPQLMQVLAKPAPQPLHPALQGLNNLFHAAKPIPNPSPQATPAQAPWQAQDPGAITNRSTSLKDKQERRSSVTSSEKGK